MNQPIIQKDLYEWDEAFLPGHILSNRDYKLAESIEGLEIRDMRNGVYVKASSWVGIVHFDSFIVRIQPKITNLDLMRMIMVSKGLNHLRQTYINRTYHIEAEISLFDLIALLLADACVTIARDGLLNGYVLEDEDLSIMRGRLRVSEQVRRRFGQINRLECTYDDHHSNIVENQILNTVLAICRRYVEHPIVRERIWKLADIFDSACSPLSTDWREVRNNLTYNRMNSRYQDAHSIAWFILEGLGVRDLMQAGNTQGVAFLMDMNALFEGFITALVRTALSGNNFTIQSQAKSAGHIWDVSRNRSYTHIIPDLLIETEAGKRLAIDAKYKRYDERKLAQSDIYQTFLYAYALSNETTKMPSALLLYPSENSTMNRTRLDIRNIQGHQKARLHALGVDIPTALNGMIDKGDTVVLDRIQAAVTHLLDD